MCELSLSALGSDRESILPASEAAWLALRKPNVNSTEVAALFNASPYCTHAELFYNKRDGAELLPFEENERSKWGKRLQDAIAIGIANDQGWKVTPRPQYKRIVSARMGTSFDYVVELPDGTMALLEIKNVDGLVYRNGWIETDFGLEAPEHIEIQCQHEMHVDEMPRLYIGALIGGNRVVLLKRDYDPAVGTALEKAVRLFWTAVELNQPPEFDFVRDAKLISALYANATPGKTVAATDAIEQCMSEYNAAARIASDADDAKKAARAKLLTLVGDAEKVVGMGFTASLGIVNKGEYVCKATSYRNVRVYAKKEAKNVNA